MSFNLSSDENHLLANPRWPARERELFEKAWSEFVEGKLRSHVGIGTSGSTGAMGSLVLVSKDALKVSARAVNDRLQAGPSDIWFKTLPSFHVGGLGILVRAELAGSKIVEDRSEKWSPGAFHRELTTAGATLLSLVPTQLFDLVRENLSAPKSLRAVVIGGGRLDESLRKASCALGWPVLPSYGMSEACSQIATARSPHDPRLVPLSHVEVETDETGRLRVRGKSLLTAKIVFDGEGKATLVDPKHNGWFTSEDRGLVQGDGSLVIEGRSHDFVKIGGEGVVVSRLEEKLESAKLKLGFKKDAALIAARDERLGARIVLMSTATDDESKRLVESFNAEVAPYERVRDVHTVGQIPRSELGKLLRARALALVGLESAADI